MQKKKVAFPSPLILPSVIFYSTSDSDSASTFVVLLFFYSSTFLLSFLFFLYLSFLFFRTTRTCSVPSTVSHADLQNQSHRSRSEISIMKLKPLSLSKNDVVNTNSTQDQPQSDVVRIQKRKSDKKKKKQQNLISVALCFQKLGNPTESFQEIPLNDDVSMTNRSAAAPPSSTPAPAQAMDDIPLRTLEEGNFYPSPPHMHQQQWSQNRSRSAQQIFTRLADSINPRNVRSQVNNTKY